MGSPALIKAGDTVIFDENGERLSIIRIKENIKVRIGKAHVPMSQFIGVPFGAAFHVQPDSTLERIKDCPVTEWAQGQITSTDKSNDALFDRNTDNQKLSAEDIEAMKQEGKAGQDIIDALCSNSATFQAKTEFSQEKYKRKKAKKYLVVLTLRRPTARLLCQAHYDKGPERVANLRPDSLAIMLSLANVAAGAQVLVVDGCTGVVTAAVVERMGGLGAVVAAYLEGGACIDGAKSLNLTADKLACLHTCHLATLHELKAAPAAASSLDASKVPIGDESVQGSDQAMDVDAPAEADKPAAAEQQPQTTVTEAAPPQGTATQTSTAAVAGASNGAGPSRLSISRRDALATVAKAGFNSCILAAAKYDVISLVQQVMPLLQPSATFVIFSAWPQPLAECLTYLQMTRQAVLLQLQESWLRPYQVLPSRTHPHMTCAGTGGFILSGIKVVSTSDVPPPLPPSISWASAAALVRPTDAATAAAAGGGGGGEEEADAGRKTAGDGHQEHRGGRGARDGNRGGGRFGGRGNRGDGNGGGRGGRGGRWDRGGNKRGRHG